MNGVAIRAERWLVGTRGEGATKWPTNEKEWIAAQQEDTLWSKVLEKFNDDDTCIPLNDDEDRDIYLYRQRGN
jgi:hypothetical protein